ncbi:MAG: hypothetical protein ACYTDY_12020, partial [Planctomycetota bacterium]
MTAPREEERAASEGSMKRRTLFLGALLVLLAGLLLHIATRAPGPDMAPAQPAEPARRSAARPPAGDPEIGVEEGPSVTRGETRRGESPLSGDPDGEEPDAETATSRPPGFFPELGGRVVDLVSGEPVAGARVLYGPLPSWWGDTSGADGSFRFAIRRDPDPGSPFRLRVMARGYEVFEVTPGAEKLTVELRQLGGPQLPGRIRGRLEDSGGRPVVGVTWVVLGDEVVRLHWLAVLADEHGQFILNGIEPGPWRIWFWGGEPAHVFVPADGEALVVLRARRDRKAESWEEDDARRLAEARAERVQMEIRWSALRAKDSSDEELEALERSLLELLGKISKLEVARRAALARREVRVAGLDGKDGRILVAEFFGAASTERWRSTVRDGAARFLALFPGTWHLKLLGTSRQVEVNVPEGTGPVTVAADSLRGSGAGSRADPTRPARRSS